MGPEYSPSAVTVQHLTFNDRIARYGVRRWALLTFFLPCNGCELVSKHIARNIPVRMPLAASSKEPSIRDVSVWTAQKLGRNYLIGLLCRRLGVILVAYLTLISRSLMCSANLGIEFSVTDEFDLRIAFLLRIRCLDFLRGRGRDRPLSLDWGGS